METKMTEEQLKIQSLETEIAHIKDNSIEVEFRDISSSAKFWYKSCAPQFQITNCYYRIAQPQRETITLAQFECWYNGYESKDTRTYQLKNGDCFFINGKKSDSYEHYELIPNTEYKAYKDTLKRVVE